MQMATLTTLNIKRLKMDHTNPQLNYGAEKWRAPEIENEMSIKFDECGRVLNGVTYQSFYIIVAEWKGFYYLFVKHGAGQERFNLDKRIIPALELLDSDNRYLVLFNLYKIAGEYKAVGERETSDKYRTAFVTGRLRKRKLKDGFKIWIDA